MPARRPRSSGPRPSRAPRSRCNSLDGKRWLRNSISVWSDLRKSPEELRLKHPALFPQALAERLIECFLPAGPGVVLDPFAGTGSTLLAAQGLGKQAIGCELSTDFVRLALRRIADASQSPSSQPGDAVPTADAPASSMPVPVLHEHSATRLDEVVPPASVDLCVTSPPYWNILNQKRTADAKPVRHYGNLHEDLGTVATYDDFLAALVEVFARVWHVLKPGAHCCIVVMDLRKRDRFYPLHSDLAQRLTSVGYIYDDLLIWNRQGDYNNLRPLGYPSVFRVNKVHEFILLMQRPRQRAGDVSPLS